ncbi:RsmB/NOP family class I SAM-dependent RNA methyltransferase [Ideonella sp. DXS22W]|uniref:RsmB/NOP family class I SAM-dependent RNA methyltransferase n=1 Tax=Pseudaquabacterium inlustre TaxID=2984192 RepID=A0ABU9CAS0_9BURK
MHPSALLDLTTELLRAVLKLDAPADGIVSAFFRKHKNLGPRERHALAETAYAVLRRRPQLQHLAQSGSGALERRLALLAWAGDANQLRGAVGPHEQTWRAQVREIDLSGLPEKLRHNLPDWMANALKQQLGGAPEHADFWQLVASMDQGAPLDLRVNTLKAKREDILQELKALGVQAAPTPHSPWGIRVQGKPALQKLAMFNRGDVEVQDEGSQLLSLLVDAKRGEMVVDFCAGAGGKTLALGAAMRSTGRLYAFDVSGHRLDALKPRMARSGLSNIHPAQIAHERDERIKRLTGKIDRVLVDAPCSGLGTLRRNPDLKWRQSPQAVAELNAKQTAILDSAARLLKPGGRLVYATCSLLADENERVAEAFGAAHPDFRPLDAAEVLAKAQVGGAESLVQGPYLRLWPHRHATDGFFAAVWQRD